MWDCMGEGEKAGRVLGEARMAWEIVFPTLDANVHYEGGRLSWSTRRISAYI